MTAEPRHPASRFDLRRLAEEKAGANEGQPPNTLSPVEAGRLLHELQVHQIELEMQNEELRRAQAELEASRARYFDLYDLAPVGYFTVSEQGLILEANLTGAGLLGLTRRDLIRQPISHYILPEDQDIYDRHRKQLFETGVPQACELRMLRADAASFWARLEATVVQGGESDEPVHRFVLSDITERKRAEQQVFETNQRLQALMEAVPVGVSFSDDPTCRRITGNPALLAQFEVTLQDNLSASSPDAMAAGRQVRFFLNGRQIIDAEMPLQRAVAENRVIVPMELEVQLPSGRRWFADASGAPVRDAQGHVIGGIAVTVDVTDRKRVEEKLADLNRRKDEFLAMLSHELRNPLAPILNAVQLLQLQKNENAVQQKARAIIERQVRQLTHLVNDLLDVARAATGRIQLCREPVLVSDIVKLAVETARPLIDQRRHELTVSLPPDPIWLYADVSRMEQVVTNLLSNAAKYTNEGGRIWLSVQQEGDQAVLRVRDTGLGIAPDFLPRVFDLFTQAERSSDRSQGGLGIGLALVKRLVEMHEGTVRVSSTVGQGSEFVVSLGARPPVTPAGTTQLDSRGIAEPAERALRVLVVDDNVDAAKTLQMLVRESGHLARMAHTGTTALAAAFDYRPDVMLLDIGLPECDGYEVAKRIRQEPLLHDIVLVAVTGYERDADRQRSQQAGFDHHLVKPADFGKIREILAAAAQRAT